MVYFIVCAKIRLFKVINEALVFVLFSSDSYSMRIWIIYTVYWFVLFILYYTLNYCNLKFVHLLPMMARSCCILKIVYFFYSFYFKVFVKNLHQTILFFCSACYVFFSVHFAVELSWNYHLIAGTIIMPCCLTRNQPLASIHLIRFFFKWLINSL